jgi:hypothetical protein
VLTHLAVPAIIPLVWLKQIIQDFSWETLVSLPPSDLLALAVLAWIALFVGSCIVSALLLTLKAALTFEPLSAGVSPEVTDQSARQSQDSPNSETAKARC